ncbi:nuclear transport factor 2 family protein [Ferrovibrio sp.]|uniref:nuclear transport factor 2 family protein n=1 Tax=Ferrovibrio sp. TaxID=1917215 RepID=UPI003D2E86FB
MSEARRLPEVEAYDPIAKALDRYAQYYETLSPQSLPALRELVTPDVRFRDPFNEVRGVEPMLRAFAAMYEDCTDVRFIITGSVRQQDKAFLIWRFYFKPRRLNATAAWEVEGVTELHFTPDGRVAAHLDHWDAGGQFYGRLPLIGPVIRFLRRRLGVH